MIYHVVNGQVLKMFGCANTRLFNYFLKGNRSQQLVRNIKILAPEGYDAGSSPGGHRIVSHIISKLIKSIMESNSRWSKHWHNYEINYKANNY